MVVHIPFRKAPEDALSAPARCSATARTGHTLDTSSPSSDRGTSIHGDPLLIERPAWLPTSKALHRQHISSTRLLAEAYLEVVVLVPLAQPELLWQGKISIRRTWS